MDELRYNKNMIKTPLSPHSNALLMAFNRLRLPPHAVRYLAGKKLKTSNHWSEVFREEHAAAFTAARMTKDNIVRDTHAALVRALASGETQASFIKSLAPRLRDMGWAPPTGVDSIPHRLEKIYATNMRTARAAGQWHRIQNSKKALPFLLYALGPSEVHRAEHVAWAGTILPADDSWWDTHFTPNGFGCKCHIRQVGMAEYEQLKEAGAKTRPPETKKRAFINRSTGEITKIPVGIDPGWDWNPGKYRDLGVRRAWGNHLNKMLRSDPLALGSAVAAMRIEEDLTAGGFARIWNKPPTNPGAVDTPVGVFGGDDPALLFINAGRISEIKNKSPAINAADLVVIQNIIDTRNNRTAAGKTTGYGKDAGGKWWRAQWSGTQVTDFRRATKKEITAQEK